MGTLLQIIGGIWALIGFGNLVGMPWTGGNTNVLTFGLIFNMLLFVVPGLIVLGLGSNIIKRKSTSEDGATPDTHVRCPECRELILKEARLCKHCRTKLVPIGVS